MRYMRRGTTKVKFLTSAPVLAAPTQASLTAGVSLDVDLAALDGWQYENQPIPTPDMGSTFTSVISGEDTVGNPSMDFYDDDVTTTIYTALAKGTSGWMALLPTGQAATRPSEIWPVRVSGRNRVYDAGGNVAAMFRVQFSPSAAPTYGTQAA